MSDPIKRIDLDPGSETVIDDLVIDDAELVHLKRLDNGLYCLIVYRQDGSSVCIDIAGKHPSRGKASAVVSWFETAEEAAKRKAAANRVSAQ